MTALLEWYDANARQMPWRVGPAARRAGQRPDPYHVWLSEIMLQQTTVAAVTGYFGAFLDRWPTVHHLAAADDGQVMAAWAGLGYYARARNLLKCARKVSESLGGRFPEDEVELRALPGVGPYTAAAVAAIAFDQPATVVDGNVERVVARLFAVDQPLPQSKPQLQRLAQTLTPVRRPGDHAQAMMDLGATVCVPRQPACGICPVVRDCRARERGLQRELPRRAPATTKPVRTGTAYLACRTDGAWLLERRADTGLLGGMLGWPGTSWPPSGNEQPPLDADWQDPGTEVRHTFTHFHLRLRLQTARVPIGARPGVGRFIGAAEFDESDLPTVMRKAYRIAATYWAGN